MSFVFEQSGAPFPARELIILVTKRPEPSAILNCATFDLNGFERAYGKPGNPDPDPEPEPEK